MKKNVFITAVFALGVLGTKAQRNLNQTNFKQKASYKSESNLYSNDDGLNYDFQQATYGYDQSNLAGLTQYTKDNEMILEVRSLMNVKADGFLVVFNLTQIGESTKVTNDLINARINNFKTAIKGLGIAESNIYLDMIYLIPTFEYEVEKKLFSKTYNEVPTGFEMQKNIHIQFEDINKIDDLVTLAAENEIYDLVKLDFFVNDTESIYDTLRNKSIDHLNKKLTSFEKLDLNLKDQYHTVKDFAKAVYPETQYTDYDAFVTQSLEAVSKNSGVSKIRKPETVAYDQLAYNNYHIIVNPQILEPVVQYVYTLQVKYTLDKPKEEAKEYMLITPTGEVKKINL